MGGTGGVDTLTGLAEADWLAGLEGDDRLAGGEGDDILAGGDGSDRLAGGAGDDLYAFEAGEGGVDRISDLEGNNSAALYGFDDRDLHASLIESDLWVAVDFEPIFMVEDFAGNESAFAGVHIGDRFVRSEEMVA